MTAAIKVLLEEWMVPYMGAKKFEVVTLDNNIASQKVFLKNGFEYCGEEKEMFNLNEMGKGEGVVGIKLLKRVVQ